jgi:hypothetical protein
MDIPALKTGHFLLMEMTAAGFVPVAASLANIQFATGLSLYSVRRSLETLEDAQIIARRRRIGHAQTDLYAPGTAINGQASDEEEIEVHVRGPTMLTTPRRSLRRGVVIPFACPFSRGTKQPFDCVHPDCNTKQT